MKIVCKFHFVDNSGRTVILLQKNKKKKNVKLVQIRIFARFAVFKTNRKSTGKFEKLRIFQNVNELYSNSDVYWKIEKEHITHIFSYRASV